MGIIQAICISEVRGVQKHAIPEADLTPLMARLVKI